jgi:hypothetical protein
MRCAPFVCENRDDLLDFGITIASCGYYSAFLCVSQRKNEKYFSFPFRKSLAIIIDEKRKIEYNQGMGENHATHFERMESYGRNQEDPRAQRDP